VPDGAAQSLSRRRKDVIGLVGLVRETEQYDIEDEGVLYYDEVLRGVERLIGPAPAYSSASPTRR
jgi:hypothetical protein